ncbi:leucyl/phenylalanyl-tRNA--protein transferase [Siculibacillus lacustris]|uniref:Leucyl/phenylalanyl-tRNA--protein transferase n=1 Tax=Siculibacillus lacustris TaxID=1549641 RepID=A0A4Q9VGM5_9HYPH|nr:leucyl/phenylalanyl-tRNA--protein transferase [Siculibacillus lacustris]TBW33651.1 leucyl/phenylalanyl-tRNA--protein transferase [Siculibacillus lacustris]
MAGLVQKITADLLLDAYASGIFPMAESADDPVLFWVEPEMRGILPLDGFHLGRRLARTVRSDRFEVVCDRDFDAVVDGCAAPAPGREGTWINAEIRRLYGELFARGHVHTVECRRDGRLVGGLYGVRLGGAFFGESMFSRETDASKVALVHLVARLVAGGFTLLDTQFLTSHLGRFGAFEIPRRTYRARLRAALAVGADFHRLSPAGSGVDGATALAALGPARA